MTSKCSFGNKGVDENSSLQNTDFIHVLISTVNKNYRLIRLPTIYNVLLSKERNRTQ